MTNKLISLALLGASVFGGISSALASTSVDVVLKSGGKESVKMEESGFIYFSDGNMLIHPSASSDKRSVFPLSNVKKMLFGENSSAARVLSPGEMVLYPSVAKSEVFLANAPASAIQVDVYDMAGAMVLSQTVIGGEAVDVSSLAAGVYVVKVNGSTFKFQKQ